MNKLKPIKDSEDITRFSEFIHICICHVQFYTRWTLFWTLINIPSLSEKTSKCFWKKNTKSATI